MGGRWQIKNTSAAALYKSPVPPQTPSLLASGREVSGKREIGNEERMSAWI